MSFGDRLFPAVVMLAIAGIYSAISLVATAAALVFSLFAGPITP